MMAVIRYVEFDGNQREVEVENGLSVMAGARANSVPGIIAECGGACACATCHVYVDSKWVDQLPVRSSLEADMLEFVWDRDQNRSRLACQIKVTAMLDGMVVYIPERQA